MRRFYLSRRQSRIIVFAILLAFFVIVAISIQSRKPAPNETPSESPVDPVNDNQGGSAATGSFLVLENFHRSDRREDGKGWEIKAGKGEYDSGGSGVNLTDAVVVLFRPGVPPTKIIAAKAKVTLLSEDLAGVDAGGGVTLNYGEQLTVTTESARYEKSSGIIESDGPAVFVGEGFAINGGQMRASADEHWIELSSGVQSRFDSKNAKVFPERVPDNKASQGSVRPAKEGVVGKSKVTSTKLPKSPARERSKQEVGKKRAVKEN